MFKIVDIWGYEIKQFSTREEAENFLKLLNVFLRINCEIIEG